MILYRNDPMDVRFGRIYDCDNAYENSLIFIPLAIYQFFTIGKEIIEDKIKRGRY